MCELLAISSRIPAHTGFSLEKLASHSYSADSSNEFSNRDGWGVCYYEGNDISLLRESQAASDSQLVKFIEKNIPPTNCLISHIRQATLGNLALCNTQPFARELNGRMHVFAHNGDFPEIQKLDNYKTKRFKTIGETDSEVAFCKLLEDMTNIWKTNDQSTPPLEQRYEVICSFAEQLRQFGPANFLYADSEVLFAHAHKRTQKGGIIKPPGLYLLNRKCNGKQRQDFTANGMKITPGNSTEHQEVSILASVPLTNEPWQALGDGEVLMFSKGKQIRV